MNTTNNKNHIRDWAAAKQVHVDELGGEGHCKRSRRERTPSGELTIMSDKLGRNRYWTVLKCWGTEEYLEEL
jgi:hypothetical protein